MDKHRRKELKNLYKQNELRKMADGTDEVLANWATDKLGIPSTPLSEQIIQETDDELIIELVANKIHNYASVLYKSNPRRYKSSQAVIESMDSEKLFIYCFHQFQNYYQIGDIEKYIVSDKDFELDIIAKGFQQIDSGFAGLLEVRNLVELENYLDHKYEFLKLKVAKHIKEKLVILK